MSGKAPYELRLHGIEKEYDKLRKKYKLPKLEDMQKEFLFRIEDISPEPGMPHIHSVVYEINKLLGAVARDTSSLLTAGSFCCMHEIKTFSRSEKERSFELYKKVQKLIWKSRVDLLTGEEACAKWILNVWKEWKHIKKETLWFNKKMYGAWAHFKEYEEDLKYVK